MKWIGLTGGIACGKSAVSSYLRTKGWTVIDADTMAHLALSPGQEPYNKALEFFGTTILKENKDIDRSALGKIVFADKAKMTFLEKIIHPWVQLRVQAQRRDLELSGLKAAIYDVPLLFEKNLEAQFDAIVLVVCDQDLQIQRLKLRNGYSEQDAKIRIAAQMPLAQKMLKTSLIIKNNGTLKELEKNIDTVMGKVPI